MKKVLVTGAAGFISFHLAKVLLSQGDAVTGIDNLNDYYDINLKRSTRSEHSSTLWMYSCSAIC